MIDKTFFRQLCIGGDSMAFGASMVINDVTKYYKNNFKAVNNVNLVVEKGEFLTILGPSGSGKTSLLKLIAGFEPLSEGSIKLNDIDISTEEPYLRNIGMLFQNYALFPHMTVFENVAYPLKLRKLSKTEIKQKVNEILELVELTSFLNRYPKQLSGGQQQRVALARAIVFNPPLLLLDEPLGALDKKLRQTMQIEIKRIQRAVGITTISVTHDQEEALTMSDRICVMKEGKVMQVDTPEGLYRRPANQFVAEFIGEINLFDGTIESITDRKAYIRLVNGMVSAVALENPKDFVSQQNVLLAIRPEEIRISKEKGTFDTEFNVKVKESIYVGEALNITTTSPFNKDIFIKIPSYLAREIKNENEIYIGWDSTNATIVLRDDQDITEEQATVKEEPIRKVVMTTSIP
ncbi:ABC transporter ATP-binding protein [Paenisporosarcina sp. TG-14]|uniref:ABC transporter ATP-binding protein n=1 Tax=Paenisporosarcina sp. TG-14 TaxID=1231057 RepID=UPI001ED998DF|nr:ABC transporter ATP-binding protein [Paenisporosarcina sp. TG-14]